MNEKEFKIKKEIIKENFHEKRTIKCETPKHLCKFNEGVYEGGDIFTTENGEFIDLEFQLEDFDELELAKYVEFAENLYEKHQKHVSVYIICPKNVNVLVKEFKIKSEAEFVIKLCCVQDDPCQLILNTVKNKIMNNEFVSEDELYAIEMLPIMCNRKDRHYFRVESLKIINKLNY